VATKVDCRQRLCHLRLRPGGWFEKVIQSRRLAVSDCERARRDDRYSLAGSQQIEQRVDDPAWGRRGLALIRETSLVGSCRCSSNHRCAHFLETARSPAVGLVSSSAHKSTVIRVPMDGRRYASHPICLCRAARHTPHSSRQHGCLQILPWGRSLAGFRRRRNRK